MPLFSRLTIRLSLLYLMLGFTLGATMLINKGFRLDPNIWRLLPVHIQLLFVGWIVQMAIGVAFWILPRYWDRPRRGNVKAAAAALVLINAGLWLNIAASIMGLHDALLAAAYSLELIGVIVFMAVIWFRIVPRDVKR